MKYATVEEAGEGIKGMDGKVSHYIDQIIHYLDGSWCGREHLLLFE